jgi:hypothetical protein
MVLHLWYVTQALCSFLCDTLLLIGVMLQLWYIHQTDFRIVRILIANMYEHAWVYAGGIHKSTMSYWSKMGKQELIKTKQYLKGNRNSMLTTCFLFLVSALSQANVGGFQCLRLAVRPIVRYVSTHVLYMH